MRANVAAAVFTALLMSSGSSAENRPYCRFSLASSRPSPVITGEPAVADRASVMVQPDSPIAIVRLDLRRMHLAAGSGSFEESGHYAVDIKEREQ